MRSRTFLHVSLGILALAAAYNLGARSATAQSGMIEASEISDVPGGPVAGVVVNRMLYSAYGGNGSDPFHLSLRAPLPVPGLSRIISVDPTDGTVLLENGDWFSWEGGAWHLRGNMLGIATPTNQESWGGVKARYR